MKGIGKSLWRAYWKLHDKKKMLVARLKGYLDGLPPKTRRRIVLAMVELSVKPDNNHNVIPYLYGTDEE